MSNAPITIGITLPPQIAYTLLTTLGIILLSGVVFLILANQKPRTEPEFTAHGFLNVLAAVLAPVWLLLFAHIIWSLWQLASQFDPTQQNADMRWHILAFVGLITALGGLISAPLALVRVWTTERQTRTAEQGHMTDRISKAVEQLGAEKTVKKLNDNGQTVETSEPNIEVRIGGLLSLERISQDSVRFDKGRDHVRVMEILCAYVRENSNTRDAKDSIREKWEDFQREFPGLEGEDFKEREGLHQDADVEEYLGITQLQNWAHSLPAPRTDIQQALDIIGRRDQIDLEKAAGYTLDLRGSNLQAADMASGNWSHARLQAARMEGANLSRARMEGAYLYGARMEGASLRWARMEKANLREARMEGAYFSGARMEGANLREARMEGAYFSGARMEGADLNGARMEGAYLFKARMEGADLSEARLEGADLFKARMEGADLRWAQMDSHTSLTAAQVQTAAVRDVDWRNASWDQEQINAMFGDASVELPDHITHPAHWPDWELPYSGENDFDTQWRKWRDDPANFRPPENPDKP